VLKAALLHRSRKSAEDPHNTMDALIALLSADLLGKPAWIWFVFVGIVVALLAFDLGVLHKDDKEIGTRDSLLLSAGYIAVALIYGAWVWRTAGAPAGLAYLTGYLIEKSLSIDNLFVIALIFSTLAIPRRYQHRVLVWGVLGVIVLRALMIGLGAALISRFEWVLYLFGAFLVVTGARTWKLAEHKPDISKSPVLRFLPRHLRVTRGLRGKAFWVREPDPGTRRPVRWATPLLMALVLVEFVDLVFALDSLPAIFAITTDPFVVYTSNIFAILGLRALYSALAVMIERFKYLKYALALVLVFIGIKIFVAGFGARIPEAVSLCVTFGLIAAGVLYSLHKTRASRSRSRRPMNFACYGLLAGKRLLRRQSSAKRQPTITTP
jgi:tellurite resistance protein TerC